MKIILALFYLLSLSALGQRQVSNFQINGEYTIENSEKSVVSFVLKWMEEKGQIKGRYTDDYYSKEGADVSGTMDDFGRQFAVIFRPEKMGIRSISFLASKKGADKTATSLPVTIVTRDLEGNPLTTTELNAQIVAHSDLALPAAREPAPQVAQKEEQIPECNVGFGEIAGYCGLYGGLISEESDNTNSCDLLEADDVSLELDSERNVALYLSPVNEVVNAPSHRIGQVSANTNNPINITSRTCASLPGTKLPGDKTHCKRLNLTGTFLIERGRQHFAGTYIIYDETTRQICRYGLSINKE